MRPPYQAPPRHWPQPLVGGGQNGENITPKVHRRVKAYWQANTPQKLYVLSLRHFFWTHLTTYRTALRDDRRLPRTPIGEALFPFQAHGTPAALRIRPQEGGFVLTDNVDLGKAYTALVSIKAYEPCAVICPSRLCPN